MSSPRLWRLDVTACALFLAGVLVALAVFSHHAADLPGTVAPTDTVPRNLLGLPGAWLAHGLLTALGAAVPLLLVSWFVLVLILLLRDRWLTWTLRLAGWVLLTLAGAVLADYAGQSWPGAPVEGPGGAIGAALVQTLRQRLHPAGQVALVGGVVLLGVSLALDFVLRVFLYALRRSSAAVFRMLYFRRRQAAPIRWPIPVDVAEAPVEEEEQPEPPAEEPTPSIATKTIPIHHHAIMNAAPDAESLRHARITGPVPDMEGFANYQPPPMTLLEDAKPFDFAGQDQQLRDRAALLEKTFADFGLNVRVVGINTGPVITQFEVALETGLRVHKVTSLSDDIALNLSVPSVRIVAPIPGKNTVGIEVPNDQRAVVGLKEVILASAKKIARSKIPLFLGKDGEGRPLVQDLADMPHLLIAGSTGTGKSVCMNAIILSILMTRRPDELKMIMIDPKGGVEMSEYDRLPHLMHPVIIDVKKAEAVLAWAVDKMEERYDLLRRARVRNIAGYNELSPAEVLRRVNPIDDEERQRIPSRMPYIVVFIDEMAELMMQMKKEVEGHIIRLAQKSRAAGIHLVVATQKPTVDVITGLIKSNLPSRICFKVTNKSDSRVVLDEMGADKLLSKGDMLFLPPGTSSLIRAQGTYASDAEIQRVIAHLECDEPRYAAELIQLKSSGHGGMDALQDRFREDNLYESAIEVILREGRGSTSLLQRALGVGYGRASRMIDWMAEDGIVGAYNGSAAREVLYTPDQWASLRGQATAE
jgi:S-DNA-T family DNA segregation ATPase FtsK/SpoIIIE